MCALYFYYKWYCYLKCVVKTHHNGLLSMNKIERIKKHKSSYYTIKAIIEFIFKFTSYRFITARLYTLLYVLEHMYTCVMCLYIYENVCYNLVIITSALCILYIQPYVGCLSAVVFLFFFLFVIIPTKIN